MNTQRSIHLFKILSIFFLLNQIIACDDQTSEVDRSSEKNLNQTIAGCVKIVIINMSNEEYDKLVGNEVRVDCFLDGMQFDSTNHYEIERYAVLFHEDRHFEICKDSSTIYDSRKEKGQ